jgi:glutamate 5-kinase
VRLAGTLTLDAGAVRALARTARACCRSASSRRGDVRARRNRRLLAPDGREVARGLVNYAFGRGGEDPARPSSEIESLLGYVDEPELIHRDNLVLLG